MKKTSTISDAMKKRLKAYSLTAGALAAGASASATVQYTNLDPDYSGSIPDTVLLDIDGDGNTDFIILATSNSFTTSSLLIEQEQIFVFAGGSNTGLAGSTANSFAYPYAMNQNDLVSGGLDFNSGTGTQTMAWATFTSYSSGAFYYGNWNNQTDKYLGLKLDVNGSTHYGWMRLDVGTSTFTIKDFAYEDVACVPIQAGSQTSLAPIPAEAATAVSAADVSDNNNGTDMEVSFTVGNETTVGEYHIFVVKSASSAGFDLATAQGVAAADYTVVPTSGSNVVTTLTAIATDTDGDAITNGQPYRVFVLSTENCTGSQVDALSSPSAEITLGEPAGISDLANAGVSAWTNGKQLNIETSNSAIIGKQYQVVGMSGQVVFESTIQDQRTSVELDVPTGIYFLQLNTVDGSKTQKFLLK